MHLSTHQRKIILLYAKFIELFHKQTTLSSGEFFTTNDGDMQFHLRKNGKEYTFPVSEKELKKWRTKTNPQTKILQKLDKAMLLWFEDCWREGENPISDPEKKVGVFLFAEKIGFDSAKARYIIDRQYSHDLPSYGALTSKPKIATSFVEKYGGLYYLYRHDNNNLTAKIGYPAGIILRATVSIRYPVPYAPLDSIKGGLSRVRCKINFPLYENRDKTKLFKYDGYVSEKGVKWWHWLLQMRPSSGLVEENKDDLVLMYTEKPKVIGNQTVIKGIMVSQNQDKEMMPSISTIYLIKSQEYTLKQETILSSSGSIQMRDHAKKTDIYYRMRPRDEKVFMRNEMAVLDILDSTTWNSIDRLAIEEIFKGETKINLKGLHL